MANTSLLGSYGGIDGSALMFRNRIINGDMRIDQRNAGAAVTVNTALNVVFSSDRWQARGKASAGVFTLQQSSVAPPGFSNSIVATVTTAATPTGSDVYFIQQRIEGFNIADLAQGSATASSFTLSFWVRSSVTGTHGGSVGNNVDRSLPFSFTINAANTWEYKTITISGCPDGTWNTTNGVGLIVHFSMGTTLKGTANAWGNYNYAPTGSVDLISTNGATLYITGVQLEAGAVATPFERRPYGTELALCQRYYEKSYNIDVAAGTAGANGVFQATLMGLDGTNSFAVQILYKVTKRAIPTTITLYRDTSPIDNTWLWYTAASSGYQAPFINDSGMQGFSLRHAGGTFSTARGNAIYTIGHWTANAEL